MATESKTKPQDATDDATPQRGATRAPVQRPVRLQFDDAIDIVDAHCYNVSIGGMFVHSREGRPVGSLVRFELTLDDDSAIRGLAEVVWMRSQDHGPERVAGMGLKFRFLEQRDRQLIFKLVSQHIKERLAARHPGLGDEEDEGAPSAAAPPIRAAASTMERLPKPAAHSPSSSMSPVPAAKREVLTPLDELDDERDAVPRPAPAKAPAADANGQRSLLFDGGSQVDDFDGGSEPTGAWLQDGLREEDSGFDAQAGFGGNEAPNARYGHYAAASAHDEHEVESELYEDEDHFEQRPRPRRDIPVLTLVAVIVVVAAVSAYLWGDRLFDRGSDDVAPAPLATGLRDDSADPTAEADPAADSAAGRTDASSSAQGPVSPPDQLAIASPGADPPATSLPASPRQPPPPATASAPPAAPSAAERPFRTVRDISARVAGSAVEIVITTDGSVDASRFTQARLPDGAPRELIRLTGLGDRFQTEVIPVGIGAVRQIRTGWHRKAGGNELHVVIDLASSSARVIGVRVEGHRIIASIGG